MKKSTKFISLLLSLLMVFSSVPLMASANAVPKEINSLDEIIETENLADLVDWLVTNVNIRKDKIIGTILRYVIFGVKEIKETVPKEEAILKLSDEKAATYVVRYLDKLLATKGPGKIEISIPLNPIVIDLSSIRSFASNLKIVIPIVATRITGGNLHKLNTNGLKNINKNTSDLDVLKNLIIWLNDNIETIKTVLINSVNNKLDLGALGKVKIEGKSINQTVIEAVSSVLSPASIRKAIYDGVDLDKYEGLDLKKTEFSKSKYYNFTADQLLAAKFLTLIENTDGKDISKNEANTVLGYSLYDFFSQYAEKAYVKYVIPMLNGNPETGDEEVRDFIKKINVEGTFNTAYKFKAGHFSDIFTTGKNNGFVEQLNNIVCRTIKIMLTEEAYDKLALKEGGNENLNANLNKALKFVLPIIAKHPEATDGFDFSKFTEEAVKNMETEEMAVAVLKIFYPGWFHFDKFEEAKLDLDGAKAKLDDADSIEELLFLAVYLGNEISEQPSSGTWATGKQGHFKLAGKALKEYTDKVFEGNKFKDIEDKELIDLAYGLAVELGARALRYNRENTLFELPKAALGDDATWTVDEYVDKVVDWALNMIKGLPAIADDLDTDESKLDGNGGYYKLNLVLNTLVDFSFINGCGSETSKYFDIKVMLDKFLADFCNFDIESAVSILAKNENATVFSKKLVPAVIDIADRALTAALEYDKNVKVIEKVSDISCTQEKHLKYNETNGMLISEKIITVDHHQWNTTPVKTIPATCTEDGKKIFKCSKCGATKEEVIHALGHTDENHDGYCDRCGKLIPEFVMKGDLDGDNEITSSDARIVLRISVNLENKVSEKQMIAANVDGTDGVTASDARKILRTSVKLDTL